MSLKAKIEAVLFLTDKPLRAQAIARILGEDVQNIRQAMLELIHDYEERNGGLEIADEDGYSFQVKEQYASLMDEFLPVELSAALVRTLSAIAIKQPIAQAEIIRIRGAGAYEHIRELVNRDLVAKKDDGRSPMLTTTKKFQEYFRLTKDGKSLRNFLKKQVKAAEEKEQSEEKQLVIGEMVADGTGAGAEQQLNERIYLETHDGQEDDSGSGDAATGGGAGVATGGDGSPLADLMRKQQSFQEQLKNNALPEMSDNEESSDEATAAVAAETTATAMETTATGAEIAATEAETVVERGLPARTETAEDDESADEEAVAEPKVETAKTKKAEKAETRSETESETKEDGSALDFSPATVEIDGSVNSVS